jgi:sugar/nucleoside kinase (ribokinase family)
MSGTRPRVLCAGNLVADLFVPPLAALPEAGQLLLTDDFLPSTGGCAANVAVALTRLGIPAAVSGRVGSDFFGDFVCSDLLSKGIAVDGIGRSARYGTSKTVILPVIGEDRRYLHTFGCNVEFSAAKVDLSLLTEGDVLYIGGFLAMPGLIGEDVGTLFAEARRRGIRTVLDVVVPAGLGKSLAPQLDPVLAHTDWFLPNEEEAESLLAASHPESQAEAFLNKGCRNVVITRGGRGAYLATEQSQMSIPAFDVELVDGSGAGDALTAGLILGVLEERSAEDALRFASGVGALCCTRLGCSAGIPARAEVEFFIQTASVRCVDSAEEGPPPYSAPELDSPDIPAPLLSDAHDG